MFTDVAGGANVAVNKKHKLRDKNQDRLKNTEQA